MEKIKTPCLLSQGFQVRPGQVFRNKPIDIRILMNYYNLAE